MSNSPPLSKKNTALRWMQIAPPAAVLLVGAIYVALLATYLAPLDGFWSGDQGVKIIQVESLLQSRYATNALIYPGVALDQQQEFSPLRGQYMQHNGQSYSMFSAAFAFASSFPYALWGYPGLYIIPIASTVLLLLVCNRIVRRLLSPRWSLACVLALGLASPIFFYSVVFWEHTLAALLTTASLWRAIESIRHQRTKPLFFSGALVATAAWFRNETVLCLIALAVALLMLEMPSKRRSIFWFGVGGLAGLTPLLAFNSRVYGNPVGPHVLVAGEANYRGGLTAYALLMARMDWANLLIMPLAYPVVPLMLALCVLAIARSRLKGQLARIDAVPLLLTLLLGLYALARVGSGLQTTLLLTFPQLLLCFLPIPWQYAIGEPIARRDATGDSRGGTGAAELRHIHPSQQRDDRASQDPTIATSISAEQLARLLAWFAAVYIALAWLLQLPDGGAQWGPRVLLPAIPALGIAGFWRMTVWYRQARSLLLRSLLAFTMVVLLGAALACEIYGIRYIRDANVNMHLVTTAVAQSQQQVVVTDIWYAPTVIAPLFYDGHLIYMVDSGTRLDSLLERVSAKGITTFYYLGSRSKELSKDSRSWPRLAAVDKPRKLPFGLIGAVYRVSP